MPGLTSLPTTAGIALAIFLAGSGLGGWAGYKTGHGVGYRSGYADGYKTGVAAMAAEVERRNAAAAETAKRAKGNVDQCWDSGGAWDQEQGECRR